MYVCIFLCVCLCVHMCVFLCVEIGSPLIDVEVYDQIPESDRPALKETEVNLSTASKSPIATTGEVTSGSAKYDHQPHSWL